MYLINFIFPYRVGEKLNFINLRCQACQTFNYSNLLYFKIERIESQINTDIYKNTAIDF